MARQHDLKCWPVFFVFLADGSKVHEIRKNDRNFSRGDVLSIHEYRPESASYTGRVLFFEVTYITYGGEWGIPSDTCVMSIRRLP